MSARFAHPQELRPDMLVSRYGRLVSSICRRMTRDDEVAREAAQGVWVAVLEGLDGFRGDSSLSTWIYSIARRVVGRYAQAQRTYSTRILGGSFECGEEPQAPAGTDVEHQAWVRARPGPGAAIMTGHTVLEKDVGGLDGEHRTIRLPT